jgi:hypothetical protein
MSTGQTSKNSNRKNKCETLQGRLIRQEVSRGRLEDSLEGMQLL